MLDMERLQEDAKNGVLPALHLLGEIYLKGYEENNIEPDLEKAIEYYEKASEGGMEDSMMQLGYIYCSGNYMEPDYSKGVKYYMLAAELGNTTALGNVGMSYCNGYGVEKDEKKGFEYFMKAAEGGHWLAMKQVSDMYNMGYGVEQDKEKAAYWLQKSEEQSKLEQKQLEEKQKEQNEMNDLIDGPFKENLKFISNDKLEVSFAKKIFSNADKLKVYTLGECEFKTGKVITADPLYSLQYKEEVLIKEKTIAPGKYPVQVVVMNTDATLGLRIVGAKLKVKETEAVNYELADCVHIVNGERKVTFAGFPVECGMGCFCDEQAAQSYWKFLENWRKENKDGNIYTDYFEELFAESYKQAPDFQREGGDLLMWSNPIDGSQIAMFATGMGDGYYTDYWGTDADGEICELVILFMNPELFGMTL